MSVSGYSISNKQLFATNHSGDLTSVVVIAEIDNSYISNSDDEIDEIDSLVIKDNTNAISLTYHNGYERYYYDDYANKSKVDSESKIYFKDATICVTVLSECISHDPARIPLDDMLSKVMSMIISGVVDEGLCNYVMAVRNKLSVFYDETQCHTYEIVGVPVRSYSRTITPITFHGYHVIIGPHKFRISEKLSDYIRNNLDDSVDINFTCSLLIYGMLAIQLAQIFKEIPLISQNKSAVKK